MQTIAIIQARMGSTRLPGKVLRTIGDKPMLEHVIERAQASQTLDEVVVATTDREEDDVIKEAAHGLGVNTFRGSEHDVLDRYYQAARIYDAAPVVRLTADCPLLDPKEVDRIVKRFTQAPDVDYVGTGMTYPEGYGTEIFTFEALRQAWENANLESEREHVTSYIWKRDDQFFVERVDLSEDWSEFRVTVDHPEDLKVVSEIVDKLSENGELFGIDEVLEYLKKNPGVAKKNKHIPKYEGYYKSRKKESR